MHRGEIAGCASALFYVANWLERVRIFEHPGRSPELRPTIASGGQCSPLKRDWRSDASYWSGCRDARRRSDALFNIVRPHSIYERPIPERHRIIFYVGHLEAFDWNLLHENVLGLKSFHPEFDRLFAFGIDPVGGGLPTDQPSDWPRLETVRDYVTRIRAALDEKLEDGSLESVRSGTRRFSARHSCSTWQLSIG